MAATTPRHIGYADILFHALVSDQPEIMRIETLSQSVQANIAAGRSEGLHLVSVRWLTGEFVYMFCDPGLDMPDPDTVVAGYHQCHWAKADAPDGGAK